MNITEAIISSFMVWFLSKSFCDSQLLSDGCDPVIWVPNFGKYAENFSLDVFRDLKNIDGGGLSGKVSAC